MEMDNWLGYSIEPNSAEWFSYDGRREAGRWGYDDISWFARLGKPQRADFLRYAANWTKLQGEHWHYQPALARTLGRAQIEKPNGEFIHYYRANRSSDACRDGFDDEAVVAEIFDRTASIDVGFPREDQAGEPVSPSGQSVPEPVTIQGSIQPLVGGIPGDASCPWSRLYRTGPGSYERVFAMPLAGCFSLFVCCGGTQTQQVRAEGLPHVKSIWVAVNQPGQLVRINFDYDRRSIKVTDAESGTDLVVPEPVTGLGINRIATLDDLPDISF
jgi:hypothetical protein